MIRLRRNKQHPDSFGDDDRAPWFFTGCPDCGAPGAHVGINGGCLEMPHGDGCAWVVANRAQWPEDGLCQHGFEWCTCSAPVGSWKPGASRAWTHYQGFTEDA